MIRLEHTYVLFFTAEVAGVGVAADSTPVAVLYRNGSASGVTVTVAATATTGLYTATFTTLGAGDNWNKTDTLHLTATATIDGTAGYVAVVWDSTGDVDAVMRGTDNANTVAPPSAEANAEAVRTELATELGRIDADVSSRLAAASYVAAPSAAANAGAVRTELATELGRIDADVSSRLAAADYVEPSGTADLSPETIQDIAEAVAGNVTPGVGATSGTTDNTTLCVHQGETVTQIITAYALDGTTPLDLSGKTLELLFESQHETFIAKIVDADLAIGGDDNNVVTFTYPAIVTADRQTKVWALRDAANPRKVYLKGTVEILRAAQRTS